MRFLAMMGLERWKTWLQLVRFLNQEKQISLVGLPMDQTICNDLRLTSSGVFEYCLPGLTTLTYPQKKVGQFWDSNLDPGTPHQMNLFKVLVGMQ